MPSSRDGDRLGARLGEARLRAGLGQVDHDALHGGRRQDDEDDEQHVGEIQHRHDVDLVVDLIVFA